MRIKKLPALAILILILFIFAAVIIIHNYYPELPFEGVPKHEVAKLLAQEHALVKLQESEEYVWYGIKANQLDGSEALIEHMGESGWTFKEQMGAGYFFENQSGTDRIVTSQMWTSKYVLYKVWN